MGCCLASVLPFLLMCSIGRNAKPADEGDETEPLTHQRDQDDAEGQRDEAVSIGKGLSCLNRQREGQRRRQRDATT